MGLSLSRPQNENALTNRVYVLRWSEKYDEAIDEGRKVLKIFPNDISTIINLGESLEKKGKYTDAIQAYKTVLNIEKNHVNSIAKIGKCYEELDLHNVDLKGTVLKPNMIIPGSNSTKKASSEEIAKLQEEAKKKKMLEAAIKGGYTKKVKQ